MSARKNLVDGVVLTPMRVQWLRHLVERGETGWKRMPKGLPANRLTRKPKTQTNATWVPMEKAGWLTAEYKADRHRGLDFFFRITDRGREVLEQAITAPPWPRGD